MEPSLRRFHLRHDARGVVRAQLHVAHTSRPGAHDGGSCLEADSLEACWVVGADGGGDQEKEGGAGGADAEGRLGADHCGTEVEGVASCGGDKALFRRNEARNEVDQGRGGEGWEGNPRAGAVEASHVLLRTEEADFTGRVLVGFHALEAFAGVVEDAGGWIEGEVLVGCYSGREPAFQGGP